MLAPSSVILFCFGVFVPELERAFGWGIGAISFGATIASLAIIISSLLSGYLVDRVGVRVLVLCSMPLYAAVIIAMSRLTGNITFFYAALFAAIVLGVGVSGIVYNKATAVWFDRRLGSAWG